MHQSKFFFPKTTPLVLADQHFETKGENKRKKKEKGANR